MLAPYTLQGLLRGIEITWLFDWHWPWRALAKPWASALGALPVALLARLLLPGLAGEVAAGLLYLAGYLVVWWVIGLDPNDRAVLAELFPKSVAAFPAMSNP